MPVFINGKLPRKTPEQAAVSRVVKRVPKRLRKMVLPSKCVTITDPEQILERITAPSCALAMPSIPLKSLPTPLGKSDDKLDHILARAGAVEVFNEMAKGA